MERRAVRGVAHHRVAGAVSLRIIHRSSHGGIESSIEGHGLEYYQKISRGMKVGVAGIRVRSRYYNRENCSTIEFENVLSEYFVYSRYLGLKTDRTAA